MVRSCWLLGANMSFSFIGPWLLALWARAEEAGRGGTVNEHLGRVLPTLSGARRTDRQMVSFVQVQQFSGHLRLGVLSLHVQPRLEEHEQPGSR